MNAERWSVVREALASVLETDAPDRPAALDRACGGDEELRRSVESLLALEERAGELMNTAAAPGLALRAEDPLPGTIGPYRVLREIGRGGMGVVYLAERADGQFRKEVAVKLITFGRHDPAMERRFRRERQILAQLEHPGIARLLDGGATAEGQPYFVMEYVEGLPLLQFCESQRLDLRARLGLFLQVSDAVAYAHQRLIVHRDLKPGNILVTREGTAKLLDFGLSRVLEGEQDADVTLTGLPMMTPAYASPEQVRGEPFTVAGDVYSLGVVLYELLAEKRPYEVTTTSLVEWARAVCEKEPAPLSRAAGGAIPPRALKGDLENIAAKALAKDAAQRYASVEEFAADLRRHLDGQPVKARRATLLYRFTKLVRRHRVAVPATAAAAVLIGSFAGAAAWEAARAQRRFQEVRGLAHSVMFDLHDAIAKLPGSTAARELLVEKAMQYLEGLQREAGGNADLAREVALGYERIANVQGSLGESNLGNVRGALANYEKANTLLQGLAKKSPGDDGLRHDAARVANELTDAYSSVGKFDVAVAAAKRNIANMEAALKTHRDAASMIDLETAEASLGGLLSDEQHYAEAIPPRERELELARAVAAARPHDMEAQRSLAVADKRLGALYGVQGRYAEGRRDYEEALAIDSRRVLANPSDMRAKTDLSYDSSDLGWIAGKMGDLDGQLEAYRRTLAIRQEVAAADPNDFRAMSGLGSAYTKVGIALVEKNDSRAGAVEFRKALAVYESVARRPGVVWSLVRDMAEVHVDIGDALVRMGAANWRAEASAEYGAARRLYEGLRDRGVLPKTYLGHIQELAELERAPKLSGQ